jgi:hypothetical protein
MTKSLLFQVAASFAMVVLFVYGQQALAQEVPHRLSRSEGAPREPGSHSQIESATAR